MKIKKNVSSMDRGIRLALAVILGFLYFTGTVSGTLGLIVFILAIVMLVTSMVSFCPLYALFGLSTIKK